ncbi:MAG TPA: acyloxyacyl hydrolase [Chitinophagaceae bacterium]|nr:acyloxyacyl hydrolase [Chitinophagaceae bacterium]
MPGNFSQFILIIGFFSYTLSVTAQPGEKRIQYPRSLKNAYFGINIGYISYPFSSAQLEPGFTTGSVSIPHIAPRLILYGRPINKYLSVQISYMRPVDWVIYKNINGDQKTRSVWMNIAGLTLATQIPVQKKISLFAEAGPGFITRKGFDINGIPVIKDATYISLLAGAALQYHINKKWDLQIDATWSPKHVKDKQPHTVFYSTGFNYHLKELSKEKVESNIKSGYYFAPQLIQAGYTTNSTGYGANNFFSKKIPVFWGGVAQVKQGFSLNYQRNIFHARKVFSFDWGAGIGYWKTEKKEDEFFTLSLYPVLRFIAIRSKKTDLFFEYSVAGPAFISKKIIDNENTGQHFTFQDFMGIGLFAGTKKNWNAGIRILHFSNGNIFPQNAGVKIPLTFSLGYALQ